MVPIGQIEGEKDIEILGDVITMRNIETDGKKAKHSKIVAVRGDSLAVEKLRKFIGKKINLNQIPMATLTVDIQK